MSEKSVLKIFGLKSWK